MKHPFTRKVLEAVRPVIAAEHEYKKRHGRQAEFVPDEYEFYLKQVGNILSVLLSHCEQLEHALLFMSNYRETPAMSRAGITRAKHLRFHLENYIIRTQTLYDLVLQLVDAVFHLTNGAREICHKIIVNNIKVKHTEIPSKLKPLRKKLGEFINARHDVVHRGYYQDPDLYRVELYSVLEKDIKESGNDMPEHLSYVPNARKEIIREFIGSRKAKYSRFNACIFQLVSDIFDVLSRHFDEERLRLKHITKLMFMII